MPRAFRGPDLEPTPLDRRLLWAVGIGLLTAAFVAFAGYRIGNLKLGGSDFDQLWFAARALTNNQDPYALIGPGKEMEWIWPFVYPLTSAVGVIPFTPLPVIAARVLFAGLSAFALAFALGRYGWRLMPIMLSASFVNAAIAAQWSPLMTAALLLPALAFVQVFKPHIGLGLLLADWKRAAWMVAGIAGAALLLISLAFDPGWIPRWLAATRQTIGNTQVAAIQALGGPLLLLAVIRWRRWDARLLLVLSVVPQTPAMYTLLPLGLLAQSRMQALLFCLGTHLASWAQLYFGPRATPSTFAMVSASCLNVFVYLPWLIAVLRRPNNATA